MKTPTKAELYAQIEALTKENIALQEQLEAEEILRMELGLEPDYIFNFII